MMLLREVEKASAMTLSSLTEETVPVTFFCFQGRQFLQCVQKLGYYIGVTDTAQLLHEKRRHILVAEHIGRLSLYQDIAYFASLNSKIQYGPQIVPVSQAFCKFFRCGTDADAGNRVALLKEKSIRDECCHLTLCQCIAPEGLHMDPDSFFGRLCNICNSFKSRKSEKVRTPR